MAKRTIIAVGSILTASVGLVDAISPKYYDLPWSTNTSVGPDGPWNHLRLNVDFPDQNLYFLPSLTETSLFVPQEACQVQSAACEVPLVPLYKQSGAQSTSAKDDGGDIDVSKWGSWAKIIGASGKANYFMERFTFAGPLFVDNSAVLRATGATISFPGGARYTQSVGLFSLLDDPETIDYTRKDGTTKTANRTLSVFEKLNAVYSRSYGLHVGSSLYNVTGSLIISGFDSSRVISQPVTAGSSSTFELRRLALNVTTGGSGYASLKADKLPSDLPIGSSLQIKADPGLPYMYLPRSVCDAIAKELPIEYSSAFNLYLWKTGASTSTLLNSPHFLSFSFDNGGPIAIPFSLLNLTLTSPLTSKPTPYFPCSPYSPSGSDPYILGRAFLQGAFLGQNWATSSLWLAQAPGPRGSPASTKNIEKGDRTLTGQQGAPAWEDTWAGVLKPLTASQSEQIAKDSAAGSGSGSGLSAGAAAGIGVGVGLAVILAAIAGLLFLRRRRRNRAAAAAAAETAQELPHHAYGAGGIPPAYDRKEAGGTEQQQHGQQIFEAPTEAPAQEKPAGAVHPGYNVVPQEAPAELDTGRR